MNIKQRKILNILEFNNGLKYSELYKNFKEEDRFSYHLKQLLIQGYINKREDNYFITRLGVQITENFKSSTLEIRTLKIPINLFVCTYEDKFLIRKPFPDDICYSLPNIKAEWGIKYDSVFSEQFPAKFGATCKEIAYRSTLHLLEYTTDKKLLYDDIFVVFDVEVKDIINTDDQNLWLTEEAIKQLPNRHRPIDLFILEKNREPFNDLEFTSNFNLKKEDL